MNLLQSFVNSASRNHLILSNGCLEAFNYVNIGYEISSYIEPIIGDRRLSMRVQDKLNTLLRDSVSQLEDLGAYLAITNIGILFEPSLRLNVRLLFESISHDTLLVVCSDGIVQNDTFHFVKPTDGFGISLSGLSFLVIE